MLLYSKDLYSPSLHQSWLLHLISLRSWKQQVWTIHRFILFYFLSLKVILYSWMLYYVYAVDISAGICWLTWLSCLLILTIISNEAWSTCWLDSRRPICWHIYTAVSRKVVGKSARDNPERYCGWFCLPCSPKNFERIAREATDIRSRVLIESNKSRFDSYSRSKQCIDHIPYYLSGLSRAHFSRQPFSK